MTRGQEGKARPELPPSSSLTTRPRNHTQRVHPSQIQYNRDKVEDNGLHRATEGGSRCEDPINGKADVVLWAE